ncbi:hypothetical protein Tco_1549709 [Tanacetum coccineum]
MACEVVLGFSLFMRTAVENMGRTTQVNIWLKKVKHSLLYTLLVTSRKRRRDDQDPPPPPPKDYNRSKKKKHDSDASASKQPPVQKSPAWKTSDSREPLVQKSSSSSMQKLASPSEQPANEDPIPKDVHLSDSKDTGAAHLLKIKTRPD